uniref:DNA-directed DNA polymerase n=1 Tax=Globodera rostochiensis TaxID=31243 RepID=A0A914HIJ6_GLORO
MATDRLFVIEQTTPMRNVLRNTRGEIAHVRFLPLEEAQRPDLVMETLIQHLLDRVLLGHPPPMLVGLQLQAPGLERPYVVRLRPPEQNNAAALAAAIERLNEQSAAGIDLMSGTTQTKVLAVWPLEPNRDAENQGGGCDLGDEHHVSHNVQSLVRVHNPNDRFCLARAILLGLRDHRCRTVMPGRAGRVAFQLHGAQQHRHGPEARHLLRRAGIARDKHLYTLEDVAIFQNWLNNTHGVGQIRLVVFEKEREYSIVYKGEGRAARFNLCLLLERGHYNYIGRIEQLFKAPQYCVDCERPAYRLFHAFGCTVVCRLCLRFGTDYPCQPQQLPNGESSSRLCNDCQFVFPNDNCFAYHLTNRAPDPMDGRGQRPWRPICEWRRVCRVCGRIAYADGGHQCNVPIGAGGNCRRCKGPHGTDQPCFIQPIGDGGVIGGGGGGAQAAVANGPNNNEDNDNDDDDDEEVDEEDNLPIRLCFFDAETSQELPLQLHGRIVQKHVPMLIIAEVICERCIRAGIRIHDGHGRRAANCVCGSPRGPLMRQWSSPPFFPPPSPQDAPTYNPRRFYFHSFDDPAADPVDQFLDFLTKHGSRKVHTVCIAHNGGKFDFHLVLEALHRRSLPPKRLCTTGLKIYSMSLRGNHQRRITFKDSLNYFFCELDALVKSFDLPSDLATAKPFFPYLYIKRQHLHERLQGLPPAEFYAPDTMKPDKRAKFLRWYETTNNAFQLREQLIMYCVNDVGILRESVIRFRRLIGEHTQGLDPFLVASTAAGLALATLRRCFLPHNRLVNSPEGGYLRGRRASAESQRYIRFFELEHPGAQVQCASWSVGEAQIEDTGYRVDGLWRRQPPLRPLAIEWLGCYYHGCPVCFLDRHQRLAAGRTAEDLYESTVRRLWELEHLHGCELHVVWACAWKEQLRHDSALKRRYEAVFVSRPLDPRHDALRGGRTEPFKLHHVCGPDEEILCIDIVSLYPYVMKVNPFPVGNPRVLTREVLLQPPVPPLPWTAPTEARGLLLVRVLAPRDIRVPLLGYRTPDGRFTFPLCAWCADRRQQRPCRHGPDKRAWVSAYTHVELNKALELGYQVTDVFEVWHYDEWDDTLFRSYVNTFVGLKVQASGWPDGCVTEEQRRDYLDAFWQTEGIRLDPAKIAPNPGLRLIAKTLANSLWGKLAQRVGHTEIRYTRTPAEFHRLLVDQSVDKLDFVHVSPHMDRCVVRKRPEFSKAAPTNCLPVSIFVTSYARLHLYGYMEQVLTLQGAELLYCDTDSLYYVKKMGGPCVPEGEALGQMKREHSDRRIVEFVAGGPKNYGIRHVNRADGTDERANLKIRSFRLSYAAQQLLNFDAMKRLTLATYNIDGPIDDVLDNDDDDNDLYVYGGGEHRAIHVPFPQIGRTVYADLYTEQAHKDYRPFYAKGRASRQSEAKRGAVTSDVPPGFASGTARGRHPSNWDYKAF